MVFWSILAVVVVVVAALAWWWSGRAAGKPLPRLDQAQVQADVIEKTGPPRTTPRAGL